MANENKIENEKILIFEPHPDDVAFQISGSVFKWISEGKDLMICTITKGNNSTFDIDVTAAKIEEIMADEHERALNFIGLDKDHMIQWKYDDLGLDPGRDRLKLLKDMIWLIRKFKPITVVTLDPKNIENEENMDHKLVAMTGFEAAAMAAYPNVFREQFDEEGVDQHFVSRVLFYMSPEPDVFINITGEPLEKKIKLGFIYDSQLDLMLTESKERLKSMNVEIPLFNLSKEKIWPGICRELAAENAKACLEKYPKNAPIQHAEAFRLKYLGVLDKVKDLFPKYLNFE